MGKIVLLCIVSVLCSHPISSQTKTSFTKHASHGYINKIPTREVYKSFFNHLIFLDKIAELEESKGVNASEIRNYYKNTLKLTDSDIAELRSTAQALADLHMTNRKHHSTSSLSALESTDLTTDDLIDALTSRMSSNGFASLETYIHDNFVKYMHAESSSTSPRDSE